MKKLLFLSNGTKPSKDEYEYIGEEKLTNFSIPAIEAANKIGYAVTIGINRKYADRMSCLYPVSFYNAEIYRNPFNIKEVFRAYQNTCRELDRGDYNAIHCNTPIGGLIGRICGKRKNINKILYTAHGFHFYKGAPIVNNIVYKLIERLLAHWTDVIITMNQEDYESAQKFRLKPEGKVYKIHGVGIETEKYRNLFVDRKLVFKEFKLKEEDIVCISAGELIKNKNYEVVIRAIAILKNPTIHYLICGKGYAKNSLEKLATKLGVRDQIHFLGFRADINQLMKAADIFLLTSFREGLSRSLMEAMACGLPCVVSKIRGNVDLIKEAEGGFLCGPQSAEEVASALRRLVQDRSLRRYMGNINRKVICEYDIEVVKKEIEKIYKNIL